MAEWSKHQHDRLIRLVKFGKGWPEIGKILGRSPSACKTHYCRYVEDAHKIVKPRLAVPDLTPAQIKEAHRIRLSGRRGRMGAREIARIMGVREIQILRVFLPAQIENRKRKDRIRAPRRDPERCTPVIVPTRVLAERDRALAPMCPIRELLGDPKPGRSALDKRRVA